MFAALIFLFFAVALLAAGGVLLYFRGRTRQKAALMQSVQTSDASVASAMTPGTLVEVAGTLRCEQPLTSEMSNRSCAYYSSRVSREYLDNRRDDDSDRPGSNRRSETLAENSQFAPFSVEDETGSVPVDAQEAEIDAEQVVDRFERNTGGEGHSISFGGATLALAGGERTIGYRYTESILPVDAPVYVLGVVGERGEISAPPKDRKDQRFVISHRSEEDLDRSLGRSSLWLGLIALGLFVLGAAFGAVGIAALTGYIEFESTSALIPLFAD